MPAAILRPRTHPGPLSTQFEAVIAFDPTPRPFMTCARIVDSKGPERRNGGAAKDLGSPTFHNLNLLLPLTYLDS
jgi:hypothetical protein